MTNPHLVFKDLFSTFHHDESRELMWEWLKSTFCGNFSTELDVNEKVMIAVLYEKLEKLIDAAHIIYASKK